MALEAFAEKLMQTELVHNNVIVKSLVLQCEKRDIKSHPDNVLNIRHIFNCVHSAGVTS